MRTRNYKARTINPEVSIKPIAEKAIQSAIVKYLKLIGIEVSVTNADRTWGKDGFIRRSKVEKGHPDLTAVLPVVIQDKNGISLKLGWAFYIEVKAERGVLKPEQREKLLKLSASGALCVIARNVEEVKLLVDCFKDRQLDCSYVNLANRLLELQCGNRRAKGYKEELNTVINAMQERKALSPKQ